MLEIRDPLGHRDIGVTQRYARFLKGKKRSTFQAEEIGALLGVKNLKTPQIPQMPTLKNGRKVPVRNKRIASPEHSS